MAIAKRSADSAAERPIKKARTADAGAAPKKPSVNPVFTSALVADETDFPRGGGTSLTPLELKETREAGRKQADSEVQAVSHAQVAAGWPRLTLRPAAAYRNARPSNSSGPSAIAGVRRRTHSRQRLRQSGTRTAFVRLPSFVLGCTTLIHER